MGALGDEPLMRNGNGGGNIFAFCLDTSQDGGFVTYGEKAKSLFMSTNTNAQPEAQKPSEEDFSFSPPAPVIVREKRTRVQPQINLRQ